MTFTVSRELAIPRPLDQPVIVQLVVHKNKPIVWLFTLRTNDHALNRRMMVIAVTILCARQRSRTFRLVKENDQVKPHEISSITDSVVGASPTSAVSVKGRFVKLFAELNLGAATGT